MKPQIQYRHRTMAFKLNLLIVVLIVIGNSHTVLAYSSGAIPSSACSGMVPSHSGSPQSGTAPFELVVSAPEYTDGETITVTLQQTGSDDFKGFFVQARSVADNSRIGNFVAGSGQQLRCSDKAVSHSNDNSRTSVTLSWVAPNPAEGNIRFRATVVEAYATYWTEIYSEVVSDPADDTTVGQDTDAPPTESQATVTSHSSTSVGNGESSVYGSTMASVTSIAESTTLDGEDEDDSFSISLSACGDTKGCFREPSGCDANDCDMAVAWTPREDGSDYMVFELTTQSNGWVALGFSDDSSMGDDYVLMCVKDGDTASIISAFNSGYSNGQFDDADYGISNAQTSYENGVVKCKFRREIDSSTVSRRRRKRSDSSNFYDIDDEYTLFLGTGPASGGSATQHSDTPTVSESQIRVTTSTEDIGAQAVDYSMYQAHGVLMITAWLLLISFSLLFARFYKTTLPEKKICGVLVWFAIHRIVNIIALSAFVVPAFVIIFVKVGGYTEIGESDSNYLKAHAPLGIIVTCLCLINPLVTLCRPNPDHPRRTIWNWFHWSIGYSALGLSFVVIYMGFEMPKATAFVDDGDRGWTRWLALFLMCFFILTWILLEVLRRLKDKKLGDNNSTKNKNIEMEKVNGKESENPTENGKGVKLNYVILLVYCIISFTMYLAIIIGIATAKID